MYLEVYPDIVFILNFFIDIILIFLLKKVNKKKSNIPRMILAAILGATTAAIVSIFPWMNEAFKFAIMYVAASILMIVIAFGKLKLLELVKQWLVFIMITYFVGGLMNSIYYYTNIRLILIHLGNGNIFSNISVVYIIASISAITVFSLIIIWFLRLYHLHKPLIYDVELVLKDRKVKTKGLMDTGNCLYDPIGRKPVMVIENNLIEELLTPDIKHDMELAKDYLEGKTDEIPLEHYDKVFNFSFIPYRSVGKTGMLLGIRLDKVMIYTEKESICNEKVTAAICDNPLTDKKDYQVILHKELL
ncbi:sigma-E processing peptidase SpoIIGA [Herbinix luporum]|uniref:Sporulation sigma-E factor-processing peptidase n=1 Tax=Herbinix luporum TaxID=1679721 RepID=A0A0K8J3Z2_9FIRM|nr:sigma-E processing peptidase SpoIIGA [Herbinix luporum]CUH92371.1 putative membrane protein [Herbinix luporum]HHT58038.1 sigma-E processing peptidase SpoIIGA [Herbinix luporum]